MPRPPAYAVRARATGCSLEDSRAAASDSASSSPVASCTVIAPVVSVPVLSSTTVVTAREDSSTSAPRITMPSWAARPVPTSIAVGVASPRAQGQAITSTETAAVMAASTSWPVSSQAAKVTTAIASTTGTNTAETRSASRWIGALPDCASTTDCRMRASRVSRPMRVTRTTSRPSVFSVPPTTSSPTPSSRGRLSPVTIDSSTALAPSTTTPSVGTWVPGRTSIRIPGRRSATSTSRSSASVPGSSPRTTARLAPSASSACRAEPARDFDRASRNRPTSRNVVTTAAVSK